MTVLAAYSFDEVGDVVTDYSGNGNDFSILGTDGARNPSGHTNGGLSWTNTGGGFPTLPDVGRTPDRTVMMWLRDVDTVNANWPIVFNAPSINSGSWGLLQLSGSFHIQARNASTFVRASTPVPTDGSWHHLAGTYDGNTVRIFLDGVESGSATLAGPIRTDTDPPQLMLDWIDTTSVMDDVRLLDVALSAPEIVTLMNTPVSEVSSETNVRVYDGSAWQDSIAVRHYDGAAWTDALAVRHYDGSQWA